MDWDRIESELVRARRDLLSREMGPGPQTPDIARRQVAAVLLRCVAQAFEDEAASLARSGLSPHATMLRHQAGRLNELADDEDTTAARLEGEQVRALDPARYNALRAAVQRVTRPVGARDLGNEIVQAAARLGHAAAETLWRELVRRCAALEIPAPVDLQARLRDALRELGDAPGVAAPVADPGVPPVGELVLAAEQLADQAPVLPREELFDRIVVLSGQLKILQERTTAESDRALVRQGFGILSRMSKVHQPGWTPTLDSKLANEDWAGYVRAARERIAARDRDRELARERGRREQLAEALRELHEAERRIVFQEALERLRARVYELDGLAQRPPPDAAASEDVAWLERDARTQAAIAVRAANADEERLERVRQALARHPELAVSGRALRPLKRVFDLVEPGEQAEAEADAAPGSIDNIDRDEIEFALGELEAAAWPEEILQTRGAGNGERVLLVGGIPNLDRKRLLRDFFGWADALWEESYREHSADFRALRARIKAGAFERVIVFSRFCGHDVTAGLRDAARRHGVAYHVHPRGISIPALARFVYGSAAETAGTAGSGSQGSAAV